MNKNIELKAKASDFPRQIEIARKMSDSPETILTQKDTFFAIKKGRLKLRKFNDSSGELIFYQRSNTKKAKESSYRISPTDTPDILKETLSLALGEVGVVEKTRYLFFFRQTRIHLDVVKDLGEFIEFEYVLKPKENPKHGKNTLDELTEKLKIRPEDLISHAYIDLLLSHQ